MLIAADSSFLIAFARPEDDWHASAKSWVSELSKMQMPVMVSTIALSEFAVHGDVGQLMMSGFFRQIDFESSDAQMTGNMYQKWKASTERFVSEKVAAKNDLKIVASACRIKATHILAADGDILNIQSKLASGLRVVDYRKAYNRALLSADGQADLFD
jgi:predicted nucleic acid-binding protein